MRKILVSYLEIEDPYNSGEFELNMYGLHADKSMYKYIGQVTRKDAKTALQNLLHASGVWRSVHCTPCCYRADTSSLHSVCAPCYDCADDSVPQNLASKIRCGCGEKSWL